MLSRCAAVTMGRPMKDGWRRTSKGLYRRGNEWRAVLWFSVDNRQRVMQRTGTGPATEARKALDAMRTEAHKVRAGSLKLRTAGISTFSEALDHYLARKDPGKARCYFDRLRVELGTVRMPELGTRFERWLLMMRDAQRRVYVGKARRQTTGRTVTPGTLNVYLAYANAALNLCVRNGLLPSNPIRHVQRHRETPRHVALSPEDETRLLNAIDSEVPHIGPLVRFALAVPSRLSELTKATRAQVDMVNGTLFIPADMAKARRAITKPIPDAMRSYFASLPAECPWVFYRTVGGNRRRPELRYLPLGDFKHAWATATSAAGLAGLRFHDLRHVAASRLLAGGVPELAISAVAGWSASSNMLSRYWGETPARVLDLVRNSKAQHLGAELRLAENG